MVTSKMIFILVSISLATSIATGSPVQSENPYSNQHQPPENRTSEATETMMMMETKPTTEPSSIQYLNGGRFSISNSKQIVMVRDGGHRHYCACRRDAEDVEDHQPQNSNLHHHRIGEPDTANNDDEEDPEYYYRFKDGHREPDERHYSEEEQEDGNEHSPYRYPFDIYCDFVKTDCHFSNDIYSNSLFHYGFNEHFQVPLWHIRPHPPGADPKTGWGRLMSPEYSLPNIVDHGEHHENRTATKITDACVMIGFIFESQGVDQLQLLVQDAYGTRTIMEYRHDYPRGVDGMLLEKYANLGLAGHRARFVLQFGFQTSFPINKNHYAFRMFHLHFGPCYRDQEKPRRRGHRNGDGSDDQDLFDLKNMFLENNHHRHDSNLKQ